MYVENDFLHKINLEQLQREVKRSVVEIGKLVEMKNPNGVYKWAKSQVDSDSVPDEFNTPEFKAGVARAIKEMKEKGYIK